MPARKIDGEGCSSTSEKRPSNCSPRLRTKRGQLCAPGNDLLERGEHLAAIAHAQRERVRAIEEALELLARTGVVEDGLGPALAGAEHVAVGEPAAGHEAAEGIELHASREHVTHVHVVRLEAHALEHRRHLDLAVDALLAQHRHFRPRGGDERRGHVFVRIERERDIETRRAGVAGGGEFLARAGGLVAPLAHAPGGFRPGAPQVFPGFVDAGIARLHRHAHFSRGRADRVGPVAQAVPHENRVHRGGVLRLHLQYDAELFGEQRAGSARGAAARVV